MLRISLKGVVALAIATLPIAPLAAQTTAQDREAGAAAADEAARASITVTAPRVRQGGRSTAGAPIQTLNSQSVVYIDDLNLSTDTGRSELDRRIDMAAKEACDWLNEVYPISNPATITPADCRADAIRATQEQVRAAVARAGA